MVKHEECIEDDDEEIVREIQGIGIKNHSKQYCKGDFKISFNQSFIIDKDVEFPATEEEEIIITYRDKCLTCDEYVGKVYNIVYKHSEYYLALKKEVI